MAIEPYLFFNGRCEEALRFYEDALAAKIETVARFRESPAPLPPDLPAGWGEKIMHASFLIGDARVMASDARTDAPPEFRGFALNVNFIGEEEARRAFERLSDGGRVDMPLGPTHYAKSFGMVTDRFGVQWMVMVGRAQEG
jgi:PhnB protein